MYVQSEIPRRFQWKFIAVLTWNNTISMFVYIKDAPKILRRNAETQVCILFSAPWLPGKVHPGFIFSGACSLSQSEDPGRCFTNVSRALQNILWNFVYCRNRTSYANFKLTLCTCAQSMALGTRTKFQLEIITINVISSIIYFRETVWRARETLVKQPPGLISWVMCGVADTRNVTSYCTSGIDAVICRTRQSYINRRGCRPVLPLKNKWL